MSAQGIIVVLLSVIGFLIVSWIGIAAIFIKDKISNHDERITALESFKETQLEIQSETLELVKELHTKEIVNNVG